MKNIILTLIALSALFFSACSSEKETTFNEKGALEFLYQYMPLGDSVDYTEDYYRECIHYAFLAKEEMPWGASIPEREFKHFVVPVRVNNENLDRFRATYYEELKARVKDLSLYDAVLEVNHWCHEHVNYKGSDSRTSAPMATIKTSWGRCGEESTLLVTALRTVGIPARQVYTPRWAHCDDNHAWVEAYVDGGWHFLGACEPEPVLDLGWFNEPASRTLLLHTRVFGDYDGPEEVISRNRNYTEINVVDNYGQTAKTTFTVVDMDGKPQANLPVEFKIYNYAEFCTVVTKTTDASGQTWLTSGLGTMMAYAANNGKFGFQVFKAGKNEQVTLILDHDSNAKESFEFDMVPPAPTSVLPEVTPEMRAENDRRISQEDAQRNAYIKACKDAQNELIANTGNKTLCRIYEKTWGNYQTIADFVKYAQGKNQEIKAVELLSNITDKDLRDVTLDVLKDHFDHTPDLTSSVVSMPPELYGQYILSPRISNEMLVPFRKTLSTFFDNTETQQYHDNPALLVNWVRQNISVDDELNPQRFPISPVGVLKARKADPHSRDIFFVAMARSLCIAAQINPVNGNVQYFDGSQWMNVQFEKETSTAAGTGYLDISYEPIATVADPKYYTHFSIKKWDGQSFRLLAYDAKDPGIDDGMMLSAFEKPTPLDEGFYILTSGTRLDDGTALTHSQFFTIKADETTKVELIMRQPQSQSQVIGDLYSNNKFTEIKTGEEYSLLHVSDGYYILGLLDQGSEPTTHAMQDISAFKKDFEAKGIPMIFLFGNAEEYQKFELKHFNELPEGIVYGCYTPELKEEIVGNFKLSGNPPVFLIANTNSEVVFVKQGYTIGLGEQLLKVLAGVEK